MTSTGGNMLEAIDLNAPKLSKDKYREKYDALLARLVVLQQQARSAGLGVVVLFEGWKGAGKGSRISDLLYHLDARGTSVHVTKSYGSLDTMLISSERKYGATGFYPPMQQFWDALSSRGKITFFDRGWYSLATEYLVDRTLAAKKRGIKPNKHDLMRRIDRVVPSIESFESQLVSSNYLVVKFFFHISEDKQRKRVESLYNDPNMRWRVTEQDVKDLDHYNGAYKLYDELLKKTNFGSSEWVLINANDKRRANITVAETLVDRLEKSLSFKQSVADIEAEKKAQANLKSPDNVPYKDERSRSDEENEAIIKEANKEAQLSLSQAPFRSRFPILHNRPSLDRADHTLKLERPEYKQALREEQDKLFELEPLLYRRRIPMIIMYEGWDAAGKGGSIKRVAQALDARAYTIFPSPAPSQYELAHPHLWRYWTRLPKAGHVGIYDRSWYGRVLVERVEGFASPTQWAAAYDEINEFERDLVNWGAILIKFWVNVSPEVQLERFLAREENPDKQWKITPDDWRNRDKTPQYYAAIEDMFRLTSTEHAPWTLLESDDKYYARVKALRVINDALEKRLERFEGSEF